MPAIISGKAKGFSNTWKIRFQALPEPFSGASRVLHVKIRVNPADFIGLVIHAPQLCLGGDEDPVLGGIEGPRIQKGIGEV